MKIRRLLGLVLFTAAALAAGGKAADTAADDRFIQISLDRYFNNDAISTDDDPLDGDADFALMTFPAEELPASGSQVQWNSIRFLFPPKEDGRLNNVSCFGQTIELPAGAFVRMHLLVTATQFACTEDFLLAYADGTTETITLKVPRFQGTPGFAKKAALKVTHAHRSTGDVDGRGVVNAGGSLYGLEIELDGDKTVKSLTLPVQLQIHIFAMTLEKKMEG